MGQIVRRKRKGRPSNTDRARRNSSVAPPSPVDRRRSRRRRNVRYCFDIDDYVDDDEFYDDDEDEEVGRREKKLRLLLYEDDSRSDRRVRHAPPCSSSEDYDEDDDGKAMKKRKVGGVDREEDEIEEIRGRKWDEDEEEEEEEAGGSDFVCGTTSDHPKDVPLPDKKTLQFILDKLQKKDIYGVYAEPVDPEELPDYHDVIKHPMDFATVRKKLANGMYLTLKEFENDVLLICRNAMQYNAPDTIYYKQASSIQEQAKLRFQRLRANGDRSEIELKEEQKTTPSFPSLAKQLKKLVPQTAPDPVGSETFSGGFVRTGEFPNGSCAQTPVKLNSGEVLIAENSSLAENSLDKEHELPPGKGFISKLGRRPSIHDEDRRATYNVSVQPVTESSSIFSTFKDESKQFIPVGLQSDHSYARSLARFAATLGSVAWKVASKTIEQALPEDVKFGRGWVGEYEPLPTPVLTPGNRTLKEPHFLANFNITSDVRDDEKASINTAPSNDKARISPLNGKVLNDSGCDSQKPPVLGNTIIRNNARIPLNQESPQEARKDPRPPSVSSLQANPAFAGSNLLHQNTPSRKFIRPEKEGSPQVKLNHPPRTHVSATEPISNVSSIPSPRPGKPVSQNGNFVSLASYKHPNSNNDGFVSGRPINGKPSPVSLDCNRIIPTDNSFQQEVKPASVSRDTNQMVPMGNHLPHQHEGKPASVSRDTNRMVHMGNNLPHQPEGKPASVSRDSNRMVPMGNNLPHQQDQRGLNDPVQMMKILAQKAQPQHNSSNGFGYGSQIGLTRDDSTNAALTAAQAWMSLGGSGGFIKPPLPEKPAHDRPQPQVSRFRGSVPIPGIHFQPDKNYQQPVRTINEAHFQNRPPGFRQLVPTDLSRFQVQSGWRGVNPQMQHQSRLKQQDSCPPDLNVGYQSMGSPVRQSTGMLVDSQQPDLALQL